MLAGKKVTIPEYDFVAGKKKYDHDPVKLGENAIILMHDASASSVQAALAIVDELKERGYMFVTLDEILFD